MRGSLLLLALLPAAVVAEVFWRTPAGLPAGWSQAYSSPVRLQDGHGELRVLGAPDSLDAIHARLRREHGDRLAWMPGENVAWALVFEKGWLHRYLVQPRPPAEGGFWILALRQQVPAATPPGDAPARHQLRELPVHPQSRPSFYSLDEGTRLALEISRSPSEPAAVLGSLDAALRAEGWQPSPANTGGLRLYVRRDCVAAVSASRGSDGFTRVLRLHKPLGVE